MRARRLWIPAALLAALPAAAAPNFSGSWRMDAARSDFGPLAAPARLERTVAHQEPELKVTTTQAGSQGSATTTLAYTTDGKESVNTIRGVEVRSICNWDGEVLVIRYSRQTEQGSLDVEERWTLSGDGNTLTIYSELSGAVKGLMKVVLVK